MPEWLNPDGYAPFGVGLLLLRQSNGLFRECSINRRASAPELRCNLRGSHTFIPLLMHHTNIDAWFASFVNTCSVGAFYNSALACFADVGLELRNLTEDTEVSFPS